MPTDGAHAKFLYTILKQLDLKTIDWNSVASQLDITNGHAARMRFSRFKQHMEGIVPSPRRRTGGDVSVSGNTGRVGKKGKKEKRREKDDRSEGERIEKPKLITVKPEPDASSSLMESGHTTTITNSTFKPSLFNTNTNNTGTPNAPIAAMLPPEETEPRRQEVIVKLEPWEED